MSPLILLIALSGCVEQRGDGKDGGREEPEPEPEPAPSLGVSARRIDFGRVLPGARAEEVLTLTNEGDLPLTVTAMSTETAAYTVVGDALPLTLEPDDESVVTVVFEPLVEGMYADVLVVESDDPAGPASVLLQGGYAVPVAVCEADPLTVQLTRESATFRGSSSYDPGGFAIVDYAWTLVSTPEGSTARLGGSGANRSGFIPDLVGSYVAELVVTNEIGERSAACEATLEAVPWTGLVLEMYWEHSGDDMDLHLVRPGGELTTDGDCYYENCTWGSLDWGVAGETADDPLLDFDDILGIGPEIILLDAPEDGTFTVYVHDYPGNVYEGPNAVTLDVWVDNVLVWSEVRDVETEDEYVPFVEITFPGGVVTAP